MESVGLLEKLRALTETRVPFIVVGELAAVLNGTPLAAFEFAVVRHRGGTMAQRYGRLEVLESFAGRLYEDLLPHTQELDIGGVIVKVLDLETQIAVKEDAPGAKDLAVLPLLRATLQEKKRLGL